jgi:phosphoribosylformylglycinamidine synthase subunit PurS
MTMFAARIDVMLKEGIADPQGQTIERALPALGMSGVSGVRVGKSIEMTIEATDGREARSRIIEMCERLLANPVIETYAVRVDGELSS